jgi:hypothetical protein
VGAASHAPRINALGVRVAATLRAVRNLALASTVAVLAAAVLGVGGAVAKSGSCASGSIARQGPYVFALSIGPTETMYTPAEVKSKHPTSGEVMLAGRMVGGMAGMDMRGGGQRHLEVHICSTGGKVVTGAHPSITVNGAMVPVAVMEGVSEGVSDYHYGNNVDLKAGQKLTVVVKLNGQTAVFHATVPRSTSM